MMRILVIKLGAIGDVIRTTSILPGLKDKYKNCSIDWVTKRESFDVLKNNRLIDNACIIDDFEVKDYDLVISLDDELEACGLASKIKPRKIIGAYLGNGSRAYTKDSSAWFDMGLISRFGKQKADELKAKNKKTYQEIMYKILGLEYKKQEPVLVLDKESIEFGKKFAIKNEIKESDDVVGINTGAGGRWQDKKLSEEKTAELIDRLGNSIRNAKLILFGGPEEKERNERIQSLAKAEIIDAGCDNSLMEFASLVGLCNILVTSDSLALHVGVALKKRIACFFCPTSPNEIELYGRGIKIIPKKGCVCCYKPKCDITPDYDVDVIAKAVKDLIQK